MRGFPISRGTQKKKEYTFSDQKGERTRRFSKSACPILCLIEKKQVTFIENPKLKMISFLGINNN